MTWIDTHAHIYAAEFDADRDAVILAAKEIGFSQILMPNVDLESIAGLHALADTYPDFCVPMMGLHPCSVQANYDKVLDSLLAFFDQRSYCAVGEIGLDLFWDQSTLPMQQKAFIRQVEFAIDRNLPIAIHSRNASREVLDILQEYKHTELRGVFHCFSDGAEIAGEILELGFYLGIGGVLTFKNSGLAETLKEIPLDSMILETDAPYLAPMPYRGKRNEPSYAALVAQKLSEVKALPLEDIATITSANAKKLFGLN